MREVVKKTWIFCVLLNLKPFSGGIREGVLQMRNRLFMVWKAVCYMKTPAAVFHGVVVFGLVQQELGHFPKISCVT